MARIDKAYDILLEKEVQAYEAADIYTSKLKRYKCVVCHDWLAIATGLIQSPHFRHWNNEAGHDCELYMSNSNYSYGNASKSAYTRKLLIKENQACNIYIKKRNASFNLCLSLPALSDAEITEFQKKKTFFEIITSDGHVSKYSIDHINFIENKKFIAEDLSVAEQYKLSIYEENKIDKSIVIEGLTLTGNFFKFMGDSVSSASDFVVKKIIAGNLETETEYLFVSKVPIDFGVSGVRIKEISKIQVHVNHQDKTRRVYSIVFEQISYEAIEFCRKHGVELRAKSENSIIMWPPMPLVDDTYYSTENNLFLFDNGTNVLSRKDTNGFVEKISNRLYYIYKNEVNGLRIVPNDGKLIALEPHENELKSELLKKQLVEINKYTEISKDIQLTIITRGIVVYNQHKIEKNVKALELLSNYVIKEYMFEIKSIDSNFLLEMIKYDKRLIKMPNWLKEHKYMDKLENEDLLEYLKASRERGSINISILQMIKEM